MRHLILCLTAGFITLITTGCAQFEFDVTREGDPQSVHVGDSQDIHLAANPLQYRMRADEGHFILWIDNPSADPIELLGNQSTVIDPDGLSHPLHNQKILPFSSIKEILPPLNEPAPGPPPSMNPLNPYDQPGYISPPGIGQNDSEPSIYSWQWDDASDISLNLVFLRGKDQFEQHFTIRRVKK